jgi:hypothetical protein
MTVEQDDGIQEFDKASKLGCRPRASCSSSTSVSWWTSGFAEDAIVNTVQVYPTHGPLFQEAEHAFVSLVPQNVYCFLCSLSFHRTGQQTPHEVALEGEKDDHWYDHGEEGSRRQQVPVAALGVDQVCDLVGQHGVAC